MNENKTVVNETGVGFGGLLTLIFITLKLCGVIDWAWVWVLAPLWIGFGVTLLIVIVCFIVALIASLL